MEEWISFSPWRREEWKSHRSKKAVRQAIAYDRGRGQLKLFGRGVSGDGRLFFLGIPAEQWDEIFQEAV